MDLKQKDEPERVVSQELIEDDAAEYIEDYIMQGEETAEDGLARKTLVEEEEIKASGEEIVKRSGEELPIAPGRQM